MEQQLISIIIPARNVGDYIREAMESVLRQDYQNWELLVIENDSHDHTGSEIAKFNDRRIIHFHTTVAGLSNARNIGLKHAKGALVCFLDADDRLPAFSLSRRAEVFEENPEVCFVDGCVRTYNADMKRLLSTWCPSFTGIPHEEMAMLIPGCFSGITWMIRRDVIGQTLFNTTWTHLEDRLFFLEIAHRGQYNFVNHNTYDIRRRPGSLMTNLRELERAYSRFIRYVHELNIHDGEVERKELYRFHRMFYRTYAKHLRPYRALRHWLYMITHKKI